MPRFKVTEVVYVTAKDEATARAIALTAETVEIFIEQDRKKRYTVLLEIEDMPENTVCMDIQDAIEEGISRNHLGICIKCNVEELYE